MPNLAWVSDYGMGSSTMGNEFMSLITNLCLKFWNYVTTCCLIVTFVKLEQGWETYGLQAWSGLLLNFIQPVASLGAMGWNPRASLHPHGAGALSAGSPCCGQEAPSLETPFPPRTAVCGVWLIFFCESMAHERNMVPHPRTRTRVVSNDFWWAGAPEIMKHINSH